MNSAFIYLFVSGGCRSLVAVGLCCRASFPSLRRGPLSLQCCSALAVAALAAGHRLGCLAACEFSMRILPGPGWNPCPCVGRQILNLGPPAIPETHIFQGQIWLYFEALPHPAYQDFAYLIYLFS